MIENETCVLGCCLLDPSTIDVAAGVLTSRDFSDASLGQAFGILCDLHGAGRPIDERVIVTAFTKAGIIESIGGIAALGRWMNSVPSPSGIREYAGLVRADSQRRHLSKLADEFKRRSADPKADPVKVAEWIDCQMNQFRVGDDEGPKHFAEHVNQKLETLRAVKAGQLSAGIRTGLRELDGVIGGLRPGHLVIVGARPSIGKSAFACQLAKEIGTQGKSSLFVSLEMSGEEIAGRDLCDRFDYENATLQSGWVDDADLEAMQAYADECRSLAYHVWEAKKLTVAKLKAIAKVHRLHHGLDAIFVDYLQLLDVADNRKPRWESLSEISKELKLLARELSIPVVALVQLNRKAEGAEPTLADIREFSSAEQDGDVVVLLHREKRDSAEALIRVAKQRNGPIADVWVSYDAKACRFSDRQAVDSYGEFA
jgi:replicative DNA helicase